MKEWRTPWEWLLIVTGVITMVITLNPVVGGDGLARFASVEVLLGGSGSHSKFSLVQPLLSVPFAWLADWMGNDRAAYVAWFNLSIFAIFSAFIYRELASRYTSAVGRAWLLLMLMGSMYPHHLQNYYGEVFTSLSMFLAALLVKRRPVIAALLFALGGVNTPALLLPLAGLGAAWLVAERRLAPAAAVVVAGALVLAEMWLKHTGVGQGYLSEVEHGMPTLMPYSGRPGFSYPLLLGLISLLFSFGKGLVFFIPALLLAIAPRMRLAAGLGDRRTILALIACGLPILLYAKWWAWYGGAFWGPRFFLYLCAPACLLLAIALQDRGWSGKGFIVVLLIFLLSAWVGLDGYLFGQNEMEACWGENYSHEYLCWYVPEFSALWRPFITGAAWHASRNVRWPYAVWHMVVVAYVIAMFVGRRVRLVERRIVLVAATT